MRGEGVQVVFWHVGSGLVLVRFLLGRLPDYRWVIAGLLLPDLLDKPIGRVFWRSRFQSGRLVGHALVFPVLILALARNQIGSADRARSNLRVASLTGGVIAHQLLDAVWREERVALWPLLGAFPRKPVRGRWWMPFLVGIGREKLLEEVAGMIAIGWVRRNSSLSRRGGFHEFQRTGRLFD